MVSKKEILKTGIDLMENPSDKPIKKLAMKMALGKDHNRIMRARKHLTGLQQNLKRRGR